MWAYFELLRLYTNVCVEPINIGTLVVKGLILYLGDKQLLLTVYTECILPSLPIMPCVLCVLVENPGEIWMASCAVIGAKIPCGLQHLLRQVGRSLMFSSSTFCTSSHSPMSLWKR